MSDRHQEDEFAEIEALLAELTTEDLDLVELPDDLWAGIEAATAASPVVASAPEMFSYDAPPASGATVDEPPSSNVVSLDSRRTSRFAPLLAAAAALVVLVGGIGIYNSRSTESIVVASADLAYLAEDGFDVLGADADASVLLVEEGQDNVIKIDQSTLPDTAGESADLELWLIEPDASGNVADLVSLGLIDPDNPVEFTLPDGVDPDVYFVVDISVEPRDGDATHSGRSILRGALSDA